MMYESERMKWLEKIFAREIECIWPFQSKSRQMLVLESDGYIRKVQREFAPDRLGPIVVTGYVLTDKGHMEYCEWAAKQAEKAQA